MNDFRAPPTRTAPGSVGDALANGWQLLENHPQAALAQARAILNHSPQYPPALRLVGAALRRMGDAATAERAELDAVIAARRLPEIDRAVRLMTSGQLEQAEVELRAFLEREPNDAAAAMLLGDMLGRHGRFREGEALLRRAIAAAPAFLDAQVALASLLDLTGRSDEGLPLIEGPLAKRPDHPGGRRQKGIMLANSGRHEEALECYRALTVDHPDTVAFWICLGDTLRTLGRKMEADAAYRRGLSIDRKFGNSWWSIANLGAVPITREEMAEIEAALQATRGDPENCYHLHFALGTARAAHGEYEAAFRNFAEGNRLQSAIAPFDGNVVAAEVERTRTILTAPFFAERTGWGAPEPDPIFVVGMPRSGSTLVEQILASHPEIEGTAELPILPILIQTMTSDHGLPLNSSYRELLPRVAEEEFAALGAEYLRRARQHRKTDRPFFVDKLPHNWADVGFIKLVLPNARIVDIRRSPMDCCWSNFRLLFARGHPASYSLEGIAAYYRHYVAMMAHFDEVLPGHVHRVIYERLVDDFEPEVRRLLGYLGLAFDPACLSFHTNSRSVATASSEQVRRPLNRAGIGAWRPYAEWLGPLERALGDLEQAYAG